MPNERPTGPGNPDRPNREVGEGASPTQAPAALNASQPTPQSHMEGDTGQPMGEERRGGARGTAAMDPGTRQEVARKGGIAVSRNKQHMAEIGRKGGQAVSRNREHMAKIGRKGGAAPRGGGRSGPGGTGTPTGSTGTA
jgi:general stress protein YciG